MQCPICAGDMVAGTRHQTYEYQGETVNVDDLSGLYCQRCNESLLDRESDDRLSAAMLVLRQTVNALSVNPEEIRLARERLGLTQQQAGEILGGGANAANWLDQSLDGADSMAPGSSMQNAEKMCHCPACGWAGKLRDTHELQPAPGESAQVCPKCANEPVVSGSLPETARQAVAIMAVDGLHISEFGPDVLRLKSLGLITYEQANHC